MVSSHSEMVKEIKVVGKLCAAQRISSLLSELYHASAVM